MTASLGYYYDRYREGNIVADHTPWFMLSFAWKWYGEKKVHCKSLIDYPGYSKNKQDDTSLIKDLWQLFDDATHTVAHNGDRFDVKKSNTRFLGCGLPPPSPSKSIDTLKIAKSVFKLDSNRLGAIGQFLGLGGKEKTFGWDTWKGCIDGDPAAYKTLVRYNKRDVVLLEQVWEKLRGWSKTPALRAFTGDDACGHCGSFSLQKRGTEMTRTGAKQRVKCQSCGGWDTRKAA